MADIRKIVAAWSVIASLALLTAGTALSTVDPGTADDPIITDPVEIDQDHPPGMLETSFSSGGDRLNAIHYLADGPGPHPTVVLLHGYPGNEKNLDLAQALRRAGWNVLFFHYRGAWGSAGDFSFSNALDDVGAALAFLRAAGPEYRVDPAHIALVGHSMGGFMALAGGARDPAAVCIAAISAADLGAFGQLMTALPAAAAPFAEGADDLPMLHGFNGEVAVAELTAKADEFSLTGLAPALAGHKLLLIAGRRDKAVPVTVHDTLVAAYRGIDGLELETAVFDADHAYSWHRIGLARRVTGWLNTKCR